MNETKTMKDFMLNDVMELLKKLEADTSPSFGIMTAQHMVEHLVWTLKSCVKRAGEPENPPTEGQFKFQNFITKGAVFRHFPKEQTAADLPPLKYSNLSDAIAQIEVAVHRFYDHFDAQPDFKCYNVFMGELGFSELELFNYMHYRYHFYQFGLIEKYP